MYALRTRIKKDIVCELVAKIPLFLEGISQRNN